MDLRGNMSTHGNSHANGPGVPWYMRPGTPAADAREISTTFYEFL